MIEAKRSRFVRNSSIGVAVYGIACRSAYAADKPSCKEISGIKRRPGSIES
jgi:hypothetical protein